MKDCERFHTVRKGDTLYKISKKYNTTEANLIRQNSDINPDNLEIGSKICVASKTRQEIVCSDDSIAYNIKASDTLASIADIFNTTPAQILRDNPDLDPYNLPIGRRICISNSLIKYPPCTGGNYYVIRKGDTLYSIAAAYNISVRRLISANRIINPRNLSVGDILCIPSTDLPISIIINRSAKRLTVIKSGAMYREYLVAVGKESTPTPIGNFTVINKEIDPGGPYGTRWLGLSLRGYGIHGTNNPASIGTAASNGCIRMYNEDIEALFNITNVGTSVVITP